MREPRDSRSAGRKEAARSLLAGEDLERIVRVSTARGCALVLDEFYSHYVYDRGPGTSVSAAAYVEDVDTDPVVLLDGLTKNWRYPGLRLSWTVGPREVIDRVGFRLGCETGWIFFMPPSRTM